MSDPPFYHNWTEGEQVDVHAGMIYDAIMLYAHALNDVIEEGGNEFDGQRIARQMYNKTIKGITGVVSIDEIGNRNPDYSLQFIKDGKLIVFADYFYHKDNFTTYSDVEVVFPGGKTTPPLDHPPCGWKNELCVEEKTNFTVYIVVPCVLAAILTAVICLALFYHRKLKFERELSLETWRIHSKDLTIISKRQAFGSRGQYVALKLLRKNDIKIDRDVLIEFQQVRELNHDNLNSFIGACLEPPQLFIVSAYANKGSLQDVLENDDIQLNDNFKISLATDICKGLIYLHKSPLRVHGRLKSSHCVVDSRWVCKLTDYGLWKLRLGEEATTDTYKKYASLLWTAPELLRNTSPECCGTQKGDVYSFGIILQEIVLRGGPYCTESDLEPRGEVKVHVHVRQLGFLPPSYMYKKAAPPCVLTTPVRKRALSGIVTLVKEGIRPVYRPKVPQESCSAAMYSLMNLCWQEGPASRPSAEEILKKLKEANGGRSLHFIDNMLELMEQYANDLEIVVQQRTQQLVDEKKKTDALLYQMLPRSVAEELKLGKPVHPVAFQEVTVYFSDIVGFTKLASESTPLEVVMLLNDLYTCFDAVIDNYDVYKVETIGDAYMVVSGLPHRNGHQHAGEIATMSLDILSSLSGFKIKHRPGKQLQVRIGIHTGPVVAGVVGLKMPRYCLFGDTVNTASRLESNGLALRIHVSPTTANLLELIGGFTLEARGEVQMKGKDPMLTFWLQGKDGFTKPLPDPTLAAPLEEHEFK
ncbi:atrial natriuretic peptide receptor 2-like [Lingula anatina]|uniref:Guanylate cyclase n=1 Tax=Lingula anatina TaxID=7574 RepID=A0A2R2MNS7_LINAN|nr:atrial natriuretic peptide receptor 2-like [Lingula anatina]|eukprot:XP_023931697.1 atrial natriuretic peptide receptor 2-like [Lingula anatina]